MRELERETPRTVSSSMTECQEKHATNRRNKLPAAIGMSPLDRASLPARTYETRIIFALVSVL